VIRRDFSCEKDEITLNGKLTTRHELLGLLEVAGFSRFNPYYFVHQHEVSELVRMNNSKRLMTLKECAGTRLCFDDQFFHAHIFFFWIFINSVYDARRSEAIRSLEETKSKRDTIDSMLNMISCRIQDLKVFFFFKYLQTQNVFRFPFLE
jgi:structural maintenance of chromosome 3 (chondroitin sulfate proteoglycan 6)